MHHKLQHRCGSPAPYRLKGTLALEFHSIGIKCRHSANQFPDAYAQRRWFQHLQEWKRITPNEAHWEQEFSLDNGKTWELSWKLRFERIVANGSTK